MLSFLRQNLRWLGAGFLLTLASGFGQTWFISLFASDIKQVFDLSDGGWGQLYTVATLSAALLMFWSGSVVDRVALSRLAPSIALLFAIAALGVSLATSVWVLGFFIFLLRFCGQGMFSHMAMTAMGRWFEATRGRAISIASLGHPAGEIAFPIVAVVGIGALGWQATWLGVVALLVVLVAPLLWGLLLNDRSPHGKRRAALSTGMCGRHWTRLEATRHWLLPALVPMLLTPGFITTVIFFHQTHVADMKGWTLLEMAPGYTFFAVTSVGSAFLMGWVSDQFGPARLLPVVLLPMGFGSLLIWLGESVTSWYGVLALCGLTQGAAGAFWGIFLPVAYGTRYLGAIRSLATTVMVISTAVGPGVTGILIDQGISFPFQGIFMALWCLLLSLFSLWIRIRMQQETTDEPT